MESIVPPSPEYLTCPASKANASCTAAWQDFQSIKLETPASKTLDLLYSLLNPTFSEEKKVRGSNFSVLRDTFCSGVCIEFETSLHADAVLSILLYT